MMPERGSGAQAHGKAFAERPRWQDVERGAPSARVAAHATGVRRLFSAALETSALHRESK